MQVRNYQEAVEALYPKLRDYLEEKGYDTSKLFSCLNPDHTDSHPSCGIIPTTNEAWSCFSCFANGTIFNAAAILENLPISGQGFITETLPFLAEKYGIELQCEPPTEEELYKLDTYRAYRIAGELIIAGKPTDSFKQVISERGWSDKICHDLGVGFVADYKEFRENLKQAGFAVKFLNEIDLNREAIFGKDRLIFTIRDADKRTVGFASRDLNYVEGQGSSKYVNQKSTGIKCNIYQKSKRLFGFDHFLAKRGRKSKSLFIFEGYSDVVTANEHGFWNCSAIGGVALTQDHISLLKDHNIYDVVLCLDGDKAGQKATAKLLDTVLSGHKDLRVRIVIMAESKDPDEYIREHGIGKFKRLIKHSAFNWRLNQFTDDADPETVCESMIPLIVNETSYIKQEKMCHELAQSTGYTLKTIQRELYRLQNVKDAEKTRDMEHVANKLAHEIRRDPLNTQYLIHEADTSLYEIARRYEEDAFSEDAFVSRILTQKEQEEALDGSFTGFVLSSDLHELQNALAGNWKKDVWMVIGGKPNVGKTSFMSKLMWDIATQEDNDACVIYHTIDDTFEQVLPKFVCLGRGDTRLELNHVMNPKYAARDSIDSHVQEDRNEGYECILNLAKNSRLLIKDANDGISLSYADNLIRRMREKYPNRNIVYVLDNFHKMSDFSGIKDERVRFKELSKSAKTLATKHHICVITTVEYRKTQDNKRAGDQDIAETIQVQYDANLIAHIHSNLQESGPSATTIHRDIAGNRLPIIEFQVSKNKVTAFKNRLFFQFFPSSSMFRGISPEVVASLHRKEKDRQGQDGNSHQELYNELAQLIREKDWKPVKVAFEMASRLGLDLDDQEEKQQMWDIYNKCGGDVGVRSKI